MKDTRRWKYIVILFLSVITLTFQSCNKDDDAGPEENSNVDNNGGDNENENQSEDLRNVTLYKVDGENIVKERDFSVTGQALALQKDTQKHQEIWNLVKDIIPLDYRSKMNEFMIYTGEKSGIAGYVVERTPDLSKWQMGIAIDYAYEGGFNAGGELAYTIVHEFGHIITLDIKQVDSSISSGNCKSFFTGEGCARDDSNINKIYQNHWADIWTEFQDINSESDAQKFYDKYKERYVTQYASTNPGEDIAEVFATFVTRAGGVNGDNGAEKKIQIMYDDGEMVKLRDYIRGNISKSSRSFLPAPGTWKNANTFGDKNKMHCSHHKN
ncbi:hypothetical protein [Aquimarina sp. AU474]|uniref:hypothetical protein n=1 Tax=Aquimarina sp. AU474 TaxID=2108529 RepID=UPI000D6897CD|nr:hypothetical protein [Aquimarina sp. AU474]